MIPAMVLCWSVFYAVSKLTWIYYLSALQNERIATRSFVFDQICALKKATVSLRIS